jgi:uncharacterized protein (TIGR02569 family)
VLAVCRRFHELVRDLPRPDILDRRTDPWSVGDRVAFEEAEPPDLGPFVPLVAARRPLTLPAQLVHGDLTENVLFADGLDPAVIDLSLYWRPAGFAAAVVVADAVCWRGAKPGPLLDSVGNVPEFPQLLLRALLYRMTTSVLLAPADPDLAGYGPAAELALDLC